MSTGDDDETLARLTLALESHPDRLDLRHLRGALLAGMGRDAEARGDFLAVIAADPSHFGALNDLATLLHRTDFRSAALSTYAQAVKHHPENPIGRINLGQALLAQGARDQALTHLQEALRLAPDHPDAHQAMANLLQDENAFEAAERHRQKSYLGRSVTILPYRGPGIPCRVLLLVSGVGGNVPTRFILDDQTFAVSVLVVEAFADGPLPDHDVVFNAVGDADLAPSGLQAVDRVLSKTKARVLNPPDRVRATRRADVARLLGAAPGVTTPRILEVHRTEAAAAAKDLGYPLLVRTPGYHTGRHFLKVRTPADLEGALGTLPGERLLLIQYLNAADSAGRFRKYRMMLIGGRLFPLHLAVSSRWKVHYFTADMRQNPDHRDEEAAFLRDPVRTIGPQAVAALDGVAERLDLDYAGVDFAIGADASLLLFEANATMVINPPPPEALWDYRRPAVEHALDAARRVILDRAGGAPRLRPVLDAAAAATPGSG